MKMWNWRRGYLEGERVNNLAELIRLGIERGRAVQETPTAEHHPARLQLFISTVHEAPSQTQVHRELLFLSNFLPAPQIKSLKLEIYVALLYIFYY